VGQDSTVELAARTVKRGGVVIQIGEGEGRIDFGMYHVPHEAYFATSIWGALRDMTSVLEYVHQGKLRWSVETLSLSEANDALLRLKNGNVPGRIVPRYRYSVRVL
jgi:D-arabinose 1-dehydrogenase-like Zn-dependent alcohol dehydrogenase